MSHCEEGDRWRAQVYADCWARTALRSDCNQVWAEGQETRVLTGAITELLCHAGSCPGSVIHVWPLARWDMTSRDSIDSVQSRDLIIYSVNPPRTLLLNTYYAPDSVLDQDVADCGLQAKYIPHLFLYMKYYLRIQPCSFTDHCAVTAELSS